MPTIRAEYAGWERRRALASSTIARRSCLLRRLEEALDVPLVAAGATDIEGWLDSLDLVDPTRYSYLSQLSVFYRWAANAGYCERDPTADIPRPRLRRYVPRPISSADLQRALYGAEPTMAAWLALGAFQGLRCSEIANLRREDVLEQVEPQVIVVMGKGGRERVVPLHDETRRRLSVAVNGQRGRLWGVAPYRVSARVAEYLRSLGIDATAHQLRHWFATELYRATLDLRLTQEMLGHASPTTTAVYAAYSPARAAEAVRGLRL